MSADASTLPLTSAPLSRRYYGWRVLLVAAAAMVGTLPGRTQGLGLITEPLLVDFQLDRVTFATLNFWATIIGALGALGIGQLIDRIGSRAVMTGVVVCVGAVVCVMSFATSFSSLAVTMTLTRALGQSALSVVSLAIVGHWFVRRIDRAMAVYSVVMSVGFMLAFPLVGSLVQWWGWRPAWFALGATLLTVLAPIAWVVVRRSPEAIGISPDGDTGVSDVDRESHASFGLKPEATHRTEEDGLRRQADQTETRGFRLQAEGASWGDALRTPTFWVFAIGAALYGLVASGIGLFNESILTERGFGPQIYYQSLVVTALTALAGNFLAGWLATRTPLPWLLATSLFVLSAGVVVVPHLGSVPQVMLWATAMGISGGFVMVLFFSVWARVFGRRHLGRIQGSAQALTVLASALGPLLLAWCVEWTGSYATMFRVLSAVIAVVAVAALTTSDRPLRR